MKKILEVRFVNFGAHVISHVLFCDKERVDLAQYVLDINNPGFVDGDIPSIKQETSIWLETLNSADAPVPRIEKVVNENIYRLEFGGGNDYHYVPAEVLKAFNTFYGKEAEIYEPKKITANWVKIFPRLFVPNDLRLDWSEKVYSSSFHDGKDTAITKINQLQQTESQGLEIYELTVYETSEK